MKKLILLVILTIFFIGGGFLLLVTKFGSKAEAKAVLKVVSTPEATIFLDNQKIGKTPFEQEVDAGEFSLKLIPESTVGGLVSWEGKIVLKPNLLTYVSRDLGTNEFDSAGEILSLEKVTGKGAPLAVVSVPDGAVVSISGEERGTAPIVFEDLEPGSYDLTVSTIGYASRSVKVKTTAGYKLNAVFNLARQGGEFSAIQDEKKEAAVTPSPSVEKVEKEDLAPETPKPSASAKLKLSPPPKPYVEILDTPTGFLRVRDEPSTSTGKEVAKVDPGDYYALLDEENGWYKIEYEEGEEGWVSGTYAQKFE